jgi:integrase
MCSHRPVVEALIADRLAYHRLFSLTAGDVLAAVARWQATGATVPTVSTRWLVLRAALSWAVKQNLLRTNPLVGVKGPPRPVPRRHHTIAEVHRVLARADAEVHRLTGELDADPSSARLRRLLYSAEQGRLLVRLAADSGARRGELAVLRLGDLDGRVMTIERGLSRGVLGSTKTGRTRRLTLGATTAALITAHFAAWDERGPERVSDWVFAPDPTRRTFTKADSLSHKFRRLGLAAGVERPALHRLRHAVATHLVEHGHLLQAQGRLGHRDPATTLRHYSHATPLDDQDIADELNDLLDGR